MSISTQDRQEILRNSEEYKEFIRKSKRVFYTKEQIIQLALDNPGIRSSTSTEWKSVRVEVDPNGDVIYPPTDRAAKIEKRYMLNRPEAYPNNRYIDIFIPGLLPEGLTDPIEIEKYQSRVMETRDEFGKLKFDTSRFQRGSSVGSRIRPQSTRYQPSMVPSGRSRGLPPRRPLIPPSLRGPASRPELQESEIQPEMNRFVPPIRPSMAERMASLPPRGSLPPRVPRPPVSQRNPELVGEEIRSSIRFPPSLQIPPVPSQDRSVSGSRSRITLPRPLGSSIQVPRPIASSENNIPRDFLRSPDRSLRTRDSEEWSEILSPSRMTRPVRSPSRLSRPVRSPSRLSSPTSPSRALDLSDSVRSPSRLSSPTSPSRILDFSDSVVSPSRLSRPVRSPSRLASPTSPSRALDFSDSVMPPRATSPTRSAIPPRSGRSYLRNSSDLDIPSRALRSSSSSQEDLTSQNYYTPLGRSTPYEDEDLLNTSLPSAPRRLYSSPMSRENSGKLRISPNLE